MDAPTAHHQIGTHEDVLIFERDLVEWAARLGRPRPKVRGYGLIEEGTRELAYQIVCQVRGKEVPPTSQKFTFEVIERTWGDGLLRVLRDAISRLPPTEHRVAAASPLRAAAPPPMVQAAGFQRAFQGAYVAGGHAAPSTRALQLRCPFGV
jgi:hypothetical protein